MRNSESPTQAFGKDLVQLKLSLKGLGIGGEFKPEVGGDVVSCSLPLTLFLPGTACLPYQRAVGQRILICCLFNSSTGGASDNPLDISHIR